jgi:polyisoprenoid-binding protein YceI
MRALVFLLAFLPASWVLADWQLDPKLSRISFVSVKRGDMADVQRFTELSGTVDGQGLARVVIPFSGLDTGLALRDERTREALFETERFPQAEVSSQVDLAVWEQLAVGASQIENLEFQLDLHGQQRRLKAEVLVSRLGEERLQVTLLEPLVIKADDFALIDGLEKLKAIASVPSITPEVPVFVVLNFQRQP